MWLIFSRRKQSFGMYSVCVCPHQDPNMPQGRAGPLSSLEHTHTVIPAQTRERPAWLPEQKRVSSVSRMSTLAKNKSRAFAVKTRQLSLVYIKEGILTCSNLDSFWQRVFFIWNLSLTGTKTIGPLAISEVRRQGLQTAGL